MTIPISYTDFYKTDHRKQYPEGTTFIYSNFTPRQSLIPGIDHVVVFGIQYFIKEYLIDRFNEDFFNQPQKRVVKEYKRRLDTSLGKDKVSMDHIEALHNLGYLPVLIKALPEGSYCPIGTPVLTIQNTLPDFFWITNFLETLLSCTLWYPMTCATLAFEYKKLFYKYAMETSDRYSSAIDFQGHDFSMRGQSSIESASISGAAHLLSFKGTDTIPAIDFLEKYYTNTFFIDDDIGYSVSATEHSVMSLGGDKDELNTFKQLITKTYPEGIISIVSDTWDYWKVIDEYLPQLRDIIEQRKGKVVIRPDSGDPVKIICGDPDSDNESIRKGSVQRLWEIFGGETNTKGYKELSPCIGLIYGDAITIERAKIICESLKKQGFASTNVVFGIGSYTYQYNTRDTFGFAMKATYGIVNKEEKVIFKAPKTDSGFKTSAKGLLRVNEDYSVSQMVTRQESKQGLLESVFIDGQFVSVSLKDIREKLNDTLTID